MDELAIDGEYRRGDGGDVVRRIQEWLCLHGDNVKVDGDFGPATESAVKRFQRAHELPAEGVVGESTYEALVAPMRAALEPIAFAGDALADLVVAVAHRHLRQHPREVGGENRGPWVRLYMSGHQGDDMLWCAGFAGYCVRQACKQLGVEPPVELSWSCDKLARSAQQRGRFIDGSGGRSSLQPGCLFVRRKSAGDWDHAGIVTEVDGEAFRTIEGNTNDDGSREGYEVCARTRAFGKTDFILI